MILKVVKDYLEWERTLKRIRKIFPNFIHKPNLRILIECDLKIYQDNFRIYLDEFPEQKELRRDFFYSTYIDREGNSYIVNKFAVMRFMRRQ